MRPLRDDRQHRRESDRDQQAFGILGIAEIRDIPDHVLAEFSQRTEAIDDGEQLRPQAVPLHVVRARLPRAFGLRREQHLPALR